MVAGAVGDCARRRVDRRLWSAKVGVWQFAIFAVGTLPAVGMTIYTRRHPRF